MADLHILHPTVYPDGMPKTAELDAFIGEVESREFGGIWVIERLFHTTPVLDGYTALTWAAALTRRVRLGTGVLLMPIRNPALLARQVATLDALSGGRVTLGISLGGRESEHATIHAPFRQRARRLEEGIEVLRHLFSGEPANYEGRFYELRDATISPRPAQGDKLPIWLGAGSEPGLQRVGRVADGWLAGGGGSPEQFAANWQRVRDAAQAAGRAPDSLRNGKLFYVWVDDDVNKAREQVEHVVYSYYGPRYEVANAIFGSAEACAERLRAYVDAGVETLILGPTGLDPRQLEVISERVSPLLNH